MNLSGSRTARDRLIVALDVATRDTALELIDDLGETTRFFKVGYQLFLAEGMPLVDELIARGLSVFLDLKMDDVGETITRGVEVIANRPVGLITINGGAATMRAALAGRGSKSLPRILSLSLLSSMNASDLAELQLVGETSRFRTIDEFVLWRAKLAITAGCDGLVASGESVRMIRSAVGPDPLIVTPGVRPAGSTTDDHKRSVSPREAIEAGSDYLVVGRPIRRAADRRGMAEAIVAEIEEGLRSRG